MILKSVYSAKPGRFRRILSLSWLSVLSFYLQGWIRWRMTKGGEKNVKNNNEEIDDVIQIVSSLTY